MIKPRPRYLPGLLVTGLLHIAILYGFMQRQHLVDTPRGERNPIQWLLPMGRPAATKPPEPAKRAPHTSAAPATSAVKPITAISDTDKQAVPATAATATAAPPTPASAPDDPFAQAPATTPQRPPSASDILALAKLDLKKIDKELRAAYPERAPPPPPDSKQARLERGINAAHDAVLPKWYQAAKIIELTTPDGENKTRIYKIVTAVGPYCIYISADGRKSYSLCPN